MSNKKAEFFTKKLQIGGKSRIFALRNELNMNISEAIYQDFKAGRIDSLYAEGFSSLKAFAARYLTDHYAMMAEDCVQESIIKAYQTRQTFTSPLQMKAFLFTCVRNASISILRKVGSHQNYLNELQEDYEQELSAAIIEQETLDRLHTAIRQLPDKYRQLFDLSYEQGLSRAEVARLLGITIDGVQKRRAKMISLLREQFNDDYGMLLLLTAIQL